MDRDQLAGAVLLSVCLGSICIYFWLVFFAAPLLVLQITAFATVTVALLILAWIGLTLATTPQSKSMEEIEKELEQELKLAGGQGQTKPE